MTHITTSAPEFVDAVERELVTMRYSPAEINGKPVRALVTQPFSFSVTTP